MTKTIAANGAGVELVRAFNFPNGAADGDGVIVGRDDQAARLRANLLKPWPNIVIGVGERS